MAFVLLVVVWLTWGVSYPATAIALQGFDVVTCRVLVQLIGAGSLLLQAVLCRRRLAVPREAWADLLVVAFLYMTIMPLAMSLGVYLAGPGRTVILVYTMPIWASLFARLLLGERLTASRLAGLALGVAAVLVLVSQDLSHLAHAPAGVGFALVAALAYGLGTVWLKRRVWRIDLSVLAFWQIAIGLVPIVVLELLFRFPPDLALVGTRQWLALAFLGFLGNGAAYFAWFRIVDRLPASVSGISVLVIPCVGLASSAWLAGEAIHAQDMLAMAMIGAALLLVLAERLRIGIGNGKRAPAMRRR